MGEPRGTPEERLEHAKAEFRKLREQLRKEERRADDAVEQMAEDHERLGTAAGRYEALVELVGDVRRGIRDVDELYDAIDNPEYALDAWS